MRKLFKCLVCAVQSIVAAQLRWQTRSSTSFIGQPRWLIRYWDRVPDALTFIIEVVHMQCCNLLKGPESVVLSMVYVNYISWCPWSHSIRIQSLGFSLSQYCDDYEESDDEIKQYILTHHPSSPHDALKHHSISLKTHLIFLQLGVLECIFNKSGLPIHGHFKSSSPTTSRELRQ